MLLLCLYSSFVNDEEEQVCTRDVGRERQTKRATPISRRVRLL